MIEIGSKLIDRELGLGEVLALGHDGALRLRFASGEATRDRETLLGPGEAYLDSRGAVMGPMSWSSALEMIHDLASSNQISQAHASGDPALQDVRAWQQVALDTLEDLVVNHGETIDETYEAPLAARDWPASVIDADRAMDPSDPVNAIRICLDLAQDAMIDLRETERNVELADARDIQSQADDIVRDFLGLNGSDLAGRLTVVPSPA